MKKLATICAVLALGACETTTSDLGGTVPTPAAGGDSLIALVNQQRAAQGLAAVSSNAALERAAQSHAEDMVANNFFSHEGSDGRASSDRARAAGFCYRTVAENIAYGQRDDAQTVTTWMGSSGHRRNILLPAADSAGTGRAGDRWVLLIGQSC